MHSDCTVLTRCKQQLTTTMTYWHSISFELKSFILKYYINNLIPIHDIDEKLEKSRFFRLSTIRDHADMVLKQLKALLQIVPEMELETRFYVKLTRTQACASWRTARERWKHGDHSKKVLQSLVEHCSLLSVSGELVARMVDTGFIENPKDNS